MAGEAFPVVDEVYKVFCEFRMHFIIWLDDHDRIPPWLLLLHAASSSSTPDSFPESLSDLQQSSPAAVNYRSSSSVPSELKRIGSVL